MSHAIPAHLRALALTPEERARLTASGTISVAAPPAPSAGPADICGAAFDYLSQPPEKRTSGAIKAWALEHNLPYWPLAKQISAIMAAAPGEDAIAVCERASQAARYFIAQAPNQDARIRNRFAATYGIKPSVFRYAVALERYRSSQPAVARSA